MLKKKKNTRLEEPPKKGGDKGRCTSFSFDILPFHASSSTHLSKKTKTKVRGPKNLQEKKRKRRSFTSFSFNLLPSHAFSCTHLSKKEKKRTKITSP
jgi:hypothetical protein